MRSAGASAIIDVELLDDPHDDLVADEVTHHQRRLGLGCGGAGRDDTAVGKELRDLGQERLAKAVRGEDERLPRDGGHLALVQASYSHVRAFAPQSLADVLAITKRADDSIQSADAPICWPSEGAPMRS